MATILVVDDSATDQTEVIKVLEKNGHKTLKANDGTVAVEQAKASKPDLIIMDVVMPGLNGFQATRQICKNPDTQHIPIILVSGKSQETDRQWGMRQGARNYLVKPVDDRELMDAVNALL